MMNIYKVYFSFNNDNNWFDTDVQAHTKGEALRKVMKSINGCKVESVKQNNNQNIVL